MTSILCLHDRISHHLGRRRRNLLVQAAWDGAPETPSSGGTEVRASDRARSVAPPVEPRGSRRSEGGAASGFSRLLLHVACALACLLGLAALPAGEPTVTVGDLSVRGEVAGENLTFTLAGTIEVRQAPAEIELVAGDLVFDCAPRLPAGARLRYDPCARAYSLRLGVRGSHPFEVRFAARAAVDGEGEAAWRRSVFSIPSSRKRDLVLLCDRSDLEVQFPGALRQERAQVEGRTSITAILGPGRPFEVRWKPQVRELDAKLVFTTDSNVVAKAGVGALALDAVVAYGITQGKLDRCRFRLPPGLGVTQVRGAAIQDWTVVESGDGPAAARELVVALSRPQRKEYSLQIQAEMPLPALPAGVEVPAVEPLDGMRASGFLAVGTDNAIHLQVLTAGGLSQVDAAAFPRVTLDKGHPRALPAAKTFFYQFAALPWRVGLRLEDIVPSFDVSEETVLTVREDDLVAACSLDLDIRDAPLRQLCVRLPAGLTVAGVEGKEVEADAFSVRAADGGGQELIVPFRRPVQGRTLVAIRLELGRTPLGARSALGGPAVLGAKSQRGWVVVAAENGVEAVPSPGGSLRAVNVGSVPNRIEGAAHAFRFREAGWSLELAAAKQASGVRAEIFHLVTVGDGLIYGSAVVQYFLTGAPVDEFRFSAPAAFQSLEFVSADEPRAVRDGDAWVVKLRRKVTGNYNLGITYTLRMAGDAPLALGGLECRGVESQSGFTVMASHRSLRVTTREMSPNVVEVGREEIPANYRLLVTSPLLAAWKHVSGGQTLSVQVTAFQEGAALPAVVELMDISTRMVTGEGGEIQDITRIVYKVKNASAQFLELKRPEGVQGLGVRLLGPGGAPGAALTVTADGDRLKIPLARGRNPNEPATIEIEFGRAHPAGGGTVALAVPPVLGPLAFANWTVQVDGDLTVRPVGGSMALAGPVAPPHRLGQSLRRVATAWAVSLQRGLMPVAGLLGLLALAAVAALGLTRHRRLLLLVLPGLAALGAIILGAQAAVLAGTDGLMAAFGCADVLPRDLSFAQALTEAPGLVLEVVPSWRAGWSAATVLLPVLGLAGLVAAWRLHLPAWVRPLAAGLSLALLAAGCDTIAALRPVTLHLLTWSLPLLGLLVLGAAFVGARRAAGRVAVVPAGAASALLLLAAWGLGLAGCAGGGRAPAVADASGVAIDRIEAVLTAEKDALDIVLRLDLRSDRPASLDLLPAGAVVLSPEKIAEGLNLVSRDSGQALVMTKAGAWTPEIHALLPLPPVDEGQMRQCRLPLPVALTNAVTMVVNEPGMLIRCPTAVRSVAEDAERQSRLATILAPGEDAVFAWVAREREARREAVATYATVTGLLRCDSGVVEGRHAVDLRIAQGELSEAVVLVPEPMTVTAVEGAGLATWRFDPRSRELLARLAAPVTGEYRLLITTQIPADALPATVTVRDLGVRGARSVRGRIGLAVTPTVNVDVTAAPPVLNLDDFQREAGPLAVGLGEGVALRQAYRTHGEGGGPLTFSLTAVVSEVRVAEGASFHVGDDRLVLQSRLAIEVAKAGVFSLRLRLPAGYDIDSLAAPEVSHWDDAVGADGRREVTVHLRNRFQGVLNLAVALSQPVGDLAALLLVPRIEVVESRKHGGSLHVTAARGIRLGLAKRDGVSELTPQEAGTAPDVMAFRILRGDRVLELSTEVVKPLVHVDALHIAEVSEGLVRHTQHLRWRLRHAGARTLAVAVPGDAVGLMVNGPHIAHWRLDPDPDEAGRRTLRVELSQKYFDQVYPLQVSYETRFDREKGDLVLEGVLARQADLQRGHVVVRSTDRVELRAGAVDRNLQAAEPRQVPREFGAGDQSSAAFCYKTLAETYRLGLTAVRHAAASQREAQVTGMVVESVLTAEGDTLNRVALSLLVGGKQRLAVQLPESAAIWALTVNRRAVRPSFEQGGGDGRSFFVPLAHTATGELPVDIEFLYRARLPGGRLHGAVNLPCPVFDLPLRDVRWTVYLPEGLDCRSFGGDLTWAGKDVGPVPVTTYDLVDYERQIDDQRRSDEQQARELTNQGKQLASKGAQYEARYVLEKSYNFAMGNTAIDEDALVQLQNLNRQQALVGLVSRRKGFLQSNGFVQQANDNVDLGDTFSSEAATQLESSLNQEDSRNLDQICMRLVQTQHIAAGGGVQILVNLPRRGTAVTFTRAVQVNPSAPMAVRFAVAPPAAPTRSWAAWLALAMAGLVGFGLLALLPLAARRAVPPAPRAEAMDEDEPAAAPAAAPAPGLVDGVLADLEKREAGGGPSTPG